MRPDWFTASADATADATGAAVARLQVRGAVDWAILVTNCSAVTAAGLPVVSVPSGVVYVNGIQRDTTASGNGDTSDTRIVLTPADAWEFRWSGGDAGMRCHVNIAGVQYPAGAAPWE